jgi:hypothetical protein
MRATVTQVLVSSIGKGLVQEKFKICNSLWAQQIPVILQIYPNLLGRSFVFG